MWPAGYREGYKSSYAKPCRLLCLLATHTCVALSSCLLVYCHLVLCSSRVLTLLSYSRGVRQVPGDRHIKEHVLQKKSVENNTRGMAQLQLRGNRRPVRRRRVNMNAHDLLRIIEQENELIAGKAS